MDTWSGGCLCGAVRYEANPENPENWYCHCRMCQKWTGSAVATDAIVKKSEFRITHGEPRFFQSSSIAERGFCADCGSPMIFRAINDDWLSIQTGTLDDPEVAPPSGHYGIEGKVSWLSIRDELPQQRTEDDEWQKGKTF
jgi:hypothetical protein